MKRSLNTFGLSALLLTLLFTGCKAVGPDYALPTAPLEAQWIEYDDPGLGKAPAPVNPAWWKSAYRDPVLDKLVDEALSENLSLRSAGLRVLQARQQLAIAVGNVFPQQQALTGQAELVDQGGAGGAFTVYDLNFNLSWELDVWGGFRRQIESASAELGASVANYDGVMISLVANVAQTYLLIRTTEQRLAVSRENLTTQEESVRVTSEKVDAGEVSPLDMEQAQTLLYNTKSSLVALEQSLQQFKNSLAILLGQPPQDMRKRLGKTKPVPSVSPVVAVGMPQDLIRRRPDIRVAERQLAAQSAQIGVAVSELYPHFGVQGLIGPSVSTATGANFSDLFNGSNSGYSFVGFVDWNIFNYGRLKNNVRLQDAVFQQLLEDYRQTVLQAQAEVENALVAFFKSLQQSEALRLAAEAAQRAADISTEQYREGLVDFNTVVGTLGTLASQQDQLASIQGTVATNLVEVYLSLGGGWEIRRGASINDLIPEETKAEMKERGKYWKKPFEAKEE